MISPVTLDDPAAYFERLAAFEATHWWSAALWRVAAHWLDVTLSGRSGLDAIDIGCGAGLTLRRLAERPEIAQVVGVDPCREALAYASRWGHRVVEGSALALPFESGTFDIATCLDVVQHLPPGGIAKAAREIARVLRAGGVAVIRSNCGGDGKAVRLSSPDPATTNPSPLAGEGRVGGSSPRPWLIPPPYPPTQGGRAKRLNRQSRDGIQFDELTTTFASAGLTIRHASPVNAFGSLAQEIRGRLQPARHRAHPSGGGLPEVGKGGTVNRLMAAVGRVEAHAVGRLRLRLPFGHSAMLLAIREG
jgi:SAM-dependent methyltransferase